MPVLNHELSKIYHRRFGADLVYRNAVWNTLVKHFFSHYVQSSDHVLDLGCGYGQFINHIQSARKYGMDLNPESRRLLQPGVTFLEQDCSAPWPLASASLDLIFTSNFFEHLPTKDHLTRTLEEAYRCLRPKGRLIAMGPNIKYIPGAYWDFFDHNIALTELSLQEAVELAGFRPIRIIDRFLPASMVKVPHYPLWFIPVYLKLPWVWPWFGRQFLVIVEKPGDASEE
jgi:SAM-dependent methyltransferase